MSFDYAGMTGRNIGFVTEAEQARLRAGRVFVCGAGGMGGACVMALARAGIGHLVLADIDSFDLSNLNRQVFATLDTIGLPKAEATAAALARINPGLAVTVLGADWTGQAAALVAGADVVVNGTDDLGAALLLYRSARAAGKTVVDAYAAPLPSVYVTQAGDRAHEARLDYPTRGVAWDALTPALRAAAFRKEMEWVLTHSSSRHHIDLALVAEVVAGRRPRMSFAPMVIATGQLMAWEAIKAVLGRRRGADDRGWFLNPHRGRIERPRPALVAAVLRPFVHRALERIAG